MTRARGASRPRFRLLPTVLLTLAILGLPTVVYAWGRSSSSFDIKTVRVSGTHLVSAKKTLKILRRTYVGVNLFTVTAADVRTTLAPLSFVESVSVDRDFPDVLAVGVTEHVPAAYVLSGTRWYVIDEDGYVICTASAAAEQLARSSRSAGSGASSPSPTASSPSPGATAASQDAGASATSSDAGANGTTASDGTADAASQDQAGTAQTQTGQAQSGGTTAKLVAGPPDASLPLPRIGVSGRVREGATLSGAGVTDMLRVITALPNSYRRGLDAVEDDDGLLTLRFAGGPVVTWGGAERTVAKTVALRTVLAAYAKAGQTCTQIDVSVPDRTLAKPVLE